MNYFTERQREVIRDLAEFYWNETLGPALAGIPQDHLEKMRATYVTQVVTGLIFDDYWDQNNLTTPGS